MTSLPVLLAFDLRKTLTPEKGGIATVDVNLWEQLESDEFDNIVDQMARQDALDEFFLRSQLSGNFLHCIPRAWVRKACWPNDLVVIAFASTEIGPSRRAYSSGCMKDPYFKCTLTYSELLDSGWTSLGFDLCDDSLSTSLLYTSEEDSVLKMIPDVELSKELNECGLFRTRDSANRYALLGTGLLHEHQPFTPVEVLRMP